MMFADILNHKEWLIAAYPFVILGCLISGGICLYATIALRSRANELALWWLFLGITITMFSLSFENAWNVVARLYPDMEDHIYDSWMIASIFKIAHATGAWLHCFGAMAALNGFSGAFVRKTFFIGFVSFVAIYLSIVMFIWGTM